ncbi:MAG: hypothetical protein KJO54_12850 [Gammaproteobacteria bacterium]|nr:hypothetical protein [Gammaproteobacteria bacterium]NNF61890.1 hypothetical protein [Gammaproteobacteria bacterium]NNM19642.1 hypothetical protein [Gammaproteobacteria bacterium]
MTRFILLLCLLIPLQLLAEPPQRRPGRLPCDGMVKLYYGDELLWTKGSGEIRQLEGLVKLKEHKGKSGLQLRSLLALQPDIVAVVLESCKPRQRRFERAELESQRSSGLYLVATNYRGFKLRNIAGGQRGRGMKNIGRIVLVPASQDEGTLRSGKRSKSVQPAS